MKIINSMCGVDAHSLLTTGVHGAGSDHLALFGAASQVLSKVVWKDASENALTDLNRTSDSNWTDLDLTNYTSANAKFAILYLKTYIDSIVAGGLCSLMVRKNGTTPTVQPVLRVAYKLGARVATDDFQTVIVGLDSGQVLEYRIYIGGTMQVDSYIDVLGYIE